MRTYTYRQLLLALLRNYLLGSAIAVLGVGSVLIYSTLRATNREMSVMLVILGVSLFVMILAELTVFARQMRPVRAVFLKHSPTLGEIKEAYIRIHHLPVLAVKRIFGPHLFGMVLPAVVLAVAAIRMGMLEISYFDLALAVLGALLVACMHAMIEFFLTAYSIRPAIRHTRELALRLHGTEVSLDGRVLFSIRKKFQWSAFLIGTFPLFLYYLTVQLRLVREDTSLLIDYWNWDAMIILLGILFASLGAWLLSRDIEHPIGQIHKVMGEVRAGNLATHAPDLYPDEFSRLVAGFNHMVEGLRERDRINHELISGYFAALAAALDARDAYTAGHSERVAGYSVRIGSLAGFSEHDLEELRKTALLHDIGKIGISDTVLLKEGRLTDDEFAQIQMHPALGERILRQIEPQSLMAPFLPGVRSHHERFDGRGYPDGLKGQDIPLFGRVIAIADAYDAMTSDRPYRQGMSAEKALSILKEGRGTQWDPHFATLFIGWLEEESGPNKSAGTERTREHAG
ncbi:HD domain-containing phosphohydrolase [Paenibacillus sp. UNC499MF]|uniref:HD domain-containing phosphohydrolase n=1 Tax=Paenibacillus sp. UNC499MF TaxID=1502751 RepID=UPI00089FA225|nr:HD domain-containing phosphohydrolase [Paenibacillus sp. UNC499MF]SEF56203.1 HAMP domain-containing protein [Paenibacillus sp. UNC499MF]